MSSQCWRRFQTNQTIVEPNKTGINQKVTRKERKEQFQSELNASISSCPRSVAVLMARNVVSKLTYYFLSIIFHSLCLSGLIWQVTQISVNFFQFDVLTDVRIFTPEESKWSEKVAYVCFYDDDLINRKKLLELNISYYNKLTFRERFKSTLTSDQIFFRSPGFERKYAFLVGGGLCFQFQFKAEKAGLFFNGELVSNVTRFWLSIGHESNNYDMSRQVIVWTDWVNTEQLFTVKSNSFKILKMASPYSDHCFNYSDIGLRDKNDAIATCQSNQTHVSESKIVRETDVKFLNMSTTYQYDEHLRCAETHFKPNCNQRLFLARLTTMSLATNLYPRMSTVSFPPETEASFSVISKPKIDDIDYVTYILGALGSWIGFSFIGINPIPHFFETEGVNGAAISHNSCHSNIEFMRRELIQSKRESIKMKQELTRIKQKSEHEIESLKQKSQQEFLEQSRENAQIKRVLVQITHRISNL